MPFVVGENVGPYRLLEQLGQGGMATVFKAYHPVLDRYVAIKALHPAFSLEHNFLTRFQREAQVVARLEHPNIVPIFDYAEHEGRPYLVMKFIEGETLKARLARRSLESSEILQIVESVGAALSYAHGQGVFHRDIKPSNVLLANDDRIYLADFGLARIAQSGESTISSDVILGTPQYISPEQALGKSDLDSGTDIYSFGVLLYELVVGRVPFSADTPFSIIHDHIYAALPLPRKIKPEIPEAIELVLLRALSKDRKDRFPDVSSLVEAWRNALAMSDETRSAMSIPADTHAGSTLLTASEVLPAPVESEPEEESAPKILSESVETIGFDEITSVSKIKPRKIWAIVVGILVVCCLCGIISLIVSPRLRNAVRKIAVSRISPTPVQILSPVVPTINPSPIVPQPVDTLLPLPTLSAPVLRMTLEAAQLKVTAEPEDPYAYFDLASAYWLAGTPNKANQAFRQALDHAGQDTEFYVYAGDVFFRRQSWLMAANMYLKAVDYWVGTVPTDLMENLNQSLYLAASSPEIKSLLSQEQLDRVQPGIVKLVRARQMLYQGDVTRSQEMLDDIIAGYPDFREAELLESEILLEKDDTLAARKKLQGLMRDPGVPRWVRQTARYLNNSIR